MWKIKRSLIEDLFESAKNYYPDEFMCFLSGNKKEQIIEEFVFLPNTSGRNYASIYDSVIPIDATMIGSVHSHPSGRAMPSDADKKFFRRYLINIIISIRENKINFFDKDGKEIQVQVE